MPVHLLVSRRGLFERGVAIATDAAGIRRLCWADVPAAGAVAEGARALALPVPQAGLRHRAEPRRQAWVATWAERLHAGALLLIDYGYPRRYYLPSRSGGTLLCYYRHAPATLSCGRGSTTSPPSWTSPRWPRPASGRAGRAGAHHAGAVPLQLRRAGMPGAARRPQSADYIRAARAVQRLTAPREDGELFKVIALSRAIDGPLLGFARGDRIASRSGRPGVGYSARSASQSAIRIAAISQSCSSIMPWPMPEDLGLATVGHGGHVPGRAGSGASCSAPRICIGTRCMRAGCGRLNSDMSQIARGATRAGSGGSSVAGRRPPPADGRAPRANCRCHVVARHDAVGRRADAGRLKIRPKARPSGLAAGRRTSAPRRARRVARDTSAPPSRPSRADQHRRRRRGRRLRRRRARSRRSSRSRGARAGGCGHGRRARRHRPASRGGRTRAGSARPSTMPKRRRRG